MAESNNADVQLQRLKSEFEGLADELERLLKLKADYVGAIARFTSDREDLADRPGCLASLFGAGAGPERESAAVPAPADAEAGVESPGSVVSEIRSRLVEFEKEVRSREGPGTREAAVAKAGEAYADAIAYLKAEKEKLIA